MVTCSSLANRIGLTALLLPCILTGCARRQPPVAEIPPAEVSLETPTRETVVDEYETTGRVAAKEYVELRPRVSGHLMQVDFQDGDEVKTGQLLFQIDPKPFQAALKQAEAEVQKYQATVAKTQADLLRQEELFKNNIITKAEIELSIAERDVARASLAAATAALERSQLDIEYAEVKSPIDGRASIASIKLGNLVSPTSPGGSLLTTIVSVDPMQVYFSVDERTVLKARQMRKVEQNVVDLKRIRDLGLKVTIFLEDPAAARRRNHRLRRQPDRQADRNHPTPGRSRQQIPAPRRRHVCSRQAPRQRLPHALMVPARAIGTSLDTKFVYTVDDKDIAHMRPVQLGVRRGSLREIAAPEGGAPFTADDRIIVDGLQRVRDGDTVRERKTDPAATAEAAAPRP